MSDPKFQTGFVRSPYARYGWVARAFIAISGIIFAISFLAACGSATVATQPSPKPKVTQVAIATSEPTTRPIPTHTPTRVPTQPAHAPTPVSTTPPPPTPQPPSGAPATLFLNPMGLKGSLDCAKSPNAGFTCAVVVSSSQSAQSNLHWFAFANLPGIGFSPSAGVLAPGQSVRVIISVPHGVCGPGLFFFRGPINTHSTSWVC